MAQKFVTKKTAIKNTTRRVPFINHLSEKLTAVGILIVVILLIYGFWPGGSNPSSEVRNYSDLKNENIDIQNITDSKSLDSSTSNEIKIGSQVWMNKNRLGVIMILVNKMANPLGKFIIGLL